MTFAGSTLTYADVERRTREMASYLQTLGLEKGDRVAVMAPNIHQQPIAVLGAIRAGFVVVNVNPLYTARELKHQMQDSGAKAIIIIENFAATLQEVIAETDLKHVVVTAIGDLLPPLKGALVTAVVRHVKKWCPRTTCPAPSSSTRRFGSAAPMATIARICSRTIWRSCNTPVARPASPKGRSCCTAPWSRRC